MSRESAGGRGYNDHGSNKDLVMVLRRMYLNELCQLLAYPNYVRLDNRE